MNKEEIDKQKLDAIKKCLIKGDMVEIARKLKLSKVTIYKCMSGNILNLKVLDLAIKKAKENKILFSKINLGNSSIKS